MEEGLHGGLAFSLIMVNEETLLLILEVAGWKVMG